MTESEARGPRRGLVLGGGGVLGGTWAVGALVALEEQYGFAVSDAEIIVGTSAGSVLAALAAPEWASTIGVLLFPTHRAADMTAAPLGRGI